MDTNFVNALTDIFFRWCGPTKTVEWIKFLWEKQLLVLESNLTYDEVISFYFTGADEIQVHLVLYYDSLSLKFADFHSSHEIKTKADIAGFFEFVQKTFEEKNSDAE